MAEFVLFNLASKLLFTIASPAVRKLYEKGCSIWDARDELDKLRVTFETIHAVLLDAEKKQEGSAAVRNWIKRVKDVLYDADDFFDQVATDDMLKQQRAKGYKHLNKVSVSGFNLNPIFPCNTIAQKVKAIRKSLLEISTDMEGFKFVESLCEQRTWSVIGRQYPGSFVDPNHVYGRDKDKEAILRMLFDDESNNAEQDVTVVIAIVGIGGMGKTTLAQLVYNDKEVQKEFEERWFACISDTSDDREIIGKIFQSISRRNYGDLTVDQLQSEIRRSVEGKKFLLVLDDVWDEDHGMWQSRRSLLSSGAKGSTIIVTTRSSSAARAVEALKTHTLFGLSEEDSWNLFKRVAFMPEQEQDSRWNNLGRDIVKKCANVPLAIKSIGSLLYTKSTLQEWECFSKEELPKLGQNGSDPIMSVLKVSYDHLNSNLKQCFAYCSLFPKDHVIDKQELVYLWMAQGYIKPDNAAQTVEEVGHSYFMDLLRRSFFQEIVEDYFGEGECCKMHDILHDLAQHVAGEETIILTKSSNEVKVNRHVSVDYIINDSWAIPSTILSVNQLRSFMFMCRSSGCRPNLIQEFVHLKYLRSLIISGLGIQIVPTSIGELKHLRYLNMSNNLFRSLPNSITKLLNLCTLNISRCEVLETLPKDFKRLVNLRHLMIRDCTNLKHMPRDLKELTSLQRLDEFKAGGGTSRLDQLEGMGLSGELCIHFEDDMDDEWDGVESWQPPVNLQLLMIQEYRGRNIPKWGNGSRVSPTLTCLILFGCCRVNCLPPFRHLPNLKSLYLDGMEEMNYIAEDDVLFLPQLEKLELSGLPKLEGWWRKIGPSFMSHQLLHSLPSLSHLLIEDCPRLKWIPLCPCLSHLQLRVVNAELISEFLPTLSSVKHLEIECPDLLTRLSGESLTSLLSLYINGCRNLKDVVLPPLHLNILENLQIHNCRELELWEEEGRGVDWYSLPNLLFIKVDEVPSSQRLPSCLQNRQAEGKLEIRSHWNSNGSDV